MSMFRPGQRWISESEPELGLGSVQRLSSRTVTICFGASGENREYAQDNAPLRRVRFRINDTVKRSDGTSVTVDALKERDGLLFYSAAGKEFCETELSDAISFNKPEERLLAGQVDPPDLFDLRLRALTEHHRRRQSHVRGFIGGRIDLIPHQLYIAAEVSRRQRPRVLLADEVGLGKTIEACLILHRLLATNQVQRVLILVPESLVHQWFVELLRRFNLWFHIFDEERCAAIETGSLGANPFCDDQLVLSSIGLFTRNPTRLQQAVAAGWDLLVVDEAHHLGWSPERASPEYEVVEALGSGNAGLLLLTATPEQLGVESHFARLRLLDPDRFHRLDEFIKEGERYHDVAWIAEQLLANRPFSAEQAVFLAQILRQPRENIDAQLEKIQAGNSGSRDKLIAALLDQHGTGRVMFRNTRGTISGFPPRRASLHALPAGADPELFDRLADEFAADTGESPFQPEFSDDPRIEWLADLLRTLKSEKVLLICRTRRKVEAIDSALRQQINIKMAVFHEGLPLVQRDRNAAWFADEEGARLLVCSEIGSEGRNFQFCHHLVLFDLPLDPELLEQRIGRLDRIGQASEIQVHVPFVKGSPQEVLACWFHEGLNSFEKNLHGGRVMLEQFGKPIQDIAQDFHETEETSRPELQDLLARTKTARLELTKRLEQGRDRLLELNSFRPDVAAALVEDIRKQDRDSNLDDFMLAVFDNYNIHVEEIAPRTYFLGSAGVFADSFPGLPAEGLAVTGERQRALSREDVQFLTWDHPLVTGAMDLLLGSEKGNSSFARWPNPKVTGLYIEAIYVLECIAPPQLHVDRFLPPTPLRVLIDHRGNDVGKTIPSESLRQELRNGDPHIILDRVEVREDLVPMLLEQAQAVAESRVAGIVTQARKDMTTALGSEIGRLKELQKVNPSVRPEEIELLTQQQRALEENLSKARLRLDAIRLIQQGPVSQR